MQEDSQQRLAKRPEVAPGASSTVWQDGVRDHQLRKATVAAIHQMVARPTPSLGTRDPAVEWSREVELILYSQAGSFQAYADPRTLLSRVLAQQALLQRSLLWRPERR